ncbi:MAG: NUDIX domain-containing protein [Balneolaceae bacterium]
METIIAAGGVVYKKEVDQIKILLIYRNGVWDLPKGKLELDESVEECAVREVVEEVGVAQFPKIESTLMDTVHFYTMNGEKIKKITHWYLMQFNDLESEFTPQTEEGITKVEWCAIDEAQGKVGYKNLEKVLNEVDKLLE